jgi:hypothetical protein
MIIPYKELIVAVAVIAASFGAGWTVNGWRIGKSTAEAHLSETTAAIETLTGRINAAAIRAGEVSDGISALSASAEGARKEIENVLPKDDRACDLPAAARGVLNRSRGYAD